MKNKLFSFFEKITDDKADSRFARFSQTISKYFSTEPERERVLRYEDFDAAGDTYYATVSAWYKVLQRVFLVCLGQCEQQPALSYGLRRSLRGVHSRD